LKFCRNSKKFYVIIDVFTKIGKFDFFRLQRISFCDKKKQKEVFYIAKGIKI
jgi:hypothetical protein